MIKKQPPLPPYIQPKVYFLMIRTIAQIKKVYPIPYKHTFEYKRFKDAL